jgi:hypothetical protein
MREHLTSSLGSKNKIRHFQNKKSRNFAVFLKIAEKRATTKRRRQKKSLFFYYLEIAC